LPKSHDKPEHTDVAVAEHEYVKIIIPKEAVPGMPLDILAHDGRRVRVIVPAGMHPGMQLQAVMPPYAPPIAKLPTGKPVKM
jgi:hypothetical protein